MEIENGINNSENANLNSFALFREINNNMEINENKFFENNAEIVMLLNNLKEQVKNKLNDSNQFIHKVKLICFLSSFIFLR